MLPPATVPPNFAVPCARGDGLAVPLLAGEDDAGGAEEVDVVVEAGGGADEEVDVVDEVVVVVVVDEVDPTLEPGIDAGESRWVRVRAPAPPPYPYPVGPCSAE